MTIKCRDCGLESEAEDLFVKRRPLSPRGQVHAYCPPCHSKSHSLAIWNTLAAYGVVAALGLIAAATGTRGGWALVNFYLVILLNIPMVVLHELSHAITARLLGVHVVGITLGQGKVLFHHRVLGMNIEWRLLPFAGFTIVGAAPAHRLRTRMFLFILAGPLTHLLVVVALVCLARFSGLQLGSFTSEAAPLAALLASNAMMFVLDLWPRQSFTDHGLSSNDVRRLLKIPFMSKQEADESLAALFAREAIEADRLGHTTEALRWAKMGADASGESQAALSVMGAVLCSMGSFQEARTIFQQQLQRDDLSPATKLLYLNNVAWADVMLRDGQLLPEADRYSARAHGNMPWIPEIMETRGVVLVELGSVDEGIKLLRAAMDKHAGDAGARATDACLLAIAEKRKGNAIDAERYLEMARKLDPKCHLLGRASAGAPANTTPTGPPS